VEDLEAASIEEASVISKAKSRPLISVLSRRSRFVGLLDDVSLICRMMDLYDTQKCSVRLI
jgi:hypothetical protein